MPSEGNEAELTWSIPGCGMGGIGSVTLRNALQAAGLFEIPFRDTEEAISSKFGRAPEEVPAPLIISASTAPIGVTVA